MYHHSLWARYKGVVFSKIYAFSERIGLDTSFIQVAETSKNRSMLGGVDRSYHQYPYELLFPGSYDNVPLRKLVVTLTRDLLAHPSELVVMPGYHRAEYWAMLFVCMLLRRKRAVFVDSTGLDREKGRLKEAAKKFFFRRCDGFFCYGIRSKEYVESYGVDAKKIFFKCQAAALAHDYDVEAIRRYFMAPNLAEISSPSFLYVGRLAKEKGLYDLLEAFDCVRKKMPDASLHIVGSGVLEREIKERCTQLQLDDAVHFLGTKSPEEIGGLLLKSSAMILPSHSEPWGLVVNEALSYGCPVVASNECGCVPELVLEGKTGYAFPRGDVAALCAAMVAVAALAKDRRSVALRCLDVIQQYTPERAAFEILAGCDRIIKKTTLSVGGV